MVLIIEKKHNNQEINELLSEIKPVKIFDAKKFAGKIQWNEDPLTYQKRIRNEWN